MKLDQEYWNGRYIQEDTGWDLGMVSPPLKEYINQLNDKNLSILIPGCGSTWEADYLLEMGFTNITLLDISSDLIAKLLQKYKDNHNVTIVCDDFFEYKGQFDLILEQTFFCALLPELRSSYVQKIKELLTPQGKLAGVLFSRSFEQPGPPFGGSLDEYISLMRDAFSEITIASCDTSFHKRSESELFIIIKK